MKKFYDFLAVFDETYIDFPTSLPTIRYILLNFTQNKGGSPYMPLAGGTSDLLRWNGKCPERQLNHTIRASIFCVCCSKMIKTCVYSNEKRHDYLF
jgi:hypothetical protein